MNSDCVGVVFMRDFEVALLLEVVSNRYPVKLGQVCVFSYQKLVKSLFDSVLKVLFLLVH